MTSFREIFESLQIDKNADSNAYAIEKAIGNEVFVGISPDGYPSILLMLQEETDESYDTVTLNGIKTEFGIDCNYNYEKELKQAAFNIVSCTEDEQHLKTFFFDFFEKFFTREENVTTRQLKDEIDFIRELFANKRRPSEESLMGLWSELFIINIAEETETWIQKWPQETRATFDFSFDHIGIDVKSFGGPIRKHFFKYEQLVNRSVEQTLILSTCCKKDEAGESPIDLFNQISLKVEDSDLLLKLEKKILKITGPNTSDLPRFNSNIAENELRILEGKSIPSIKKGTFSSNVSDISFNSDCSEVPRLPFSEENQERIISGVLDFQ